VLYLHFEMHFVMLMVVLFVHFLASVGVIWA